MGYPLTIFNVIDLKQYVYCPRVSYYQTVLPDIRPTTYKMEEGILRHQEVETHEARRQLRAYGLTDGQRRFQLAVLDDQQLGLSGQIDMLIETNNELIPVDYKNSDKIGPHYKLQLMAYGRLAELHLNPAGKTVKRGFLYLLPLRQAMEVVFTPALHRQLEKAIQELQKIAQQELMPPPPTGRVKCQDCEFRRFCNDVL